MADEIIVAARDEMLFCYLLVICLVLYFAVVCQYFDWHCSLIAPRFLPLIPASAIKAMNIRMQHGNVLVSLPSITRTEAVI
jgi:hypothetical protein